MTAPKRRLRLGLMRNAQTCERQRTPSTDGIGRVLPTNSARAATYLRCSELTAVLTISARSTRYRWELRSWHGQKTLSPFGTLVLPRPVTSPHATKTTGGLPSCIVAMSAMRAGVLYTFFTFHPPVPGYAPTVQSGDTCRPYAGAFASSSIAAAPPLFLHIGKQWSSRYHDLIKLHC